MPDASHKVPHTSWRIIRIDPDKRWPFRELDVGEAFVEGDLSAWLTLRVRASQLHREFLEFGMERSWSVRKEVHGGTEVIVVRRLQ